MVFVQVGKGIKIKGLSEELKDRVRSVLSITNPQYKKMVRMGKSIHNVPAEFRYFAEEEDELTIPRGVEQRLFNFFSRCGIQPQIDRQTVSIPRALYLIPCKTLREPQRLAVEAAQKATVGILRIGTGAGKTLIACEIAATTHATTLILVPTTAILRQFESEFKTFYGVQVSVIGDGQKDVGEITIATFQSLQADPMLLQTLQENTSLLIVDECQSAVSDKRVNMIWGFKAEYIYGLSATPDRSRDDGRGEAVGFFFGPVLYSYENVSMKPRVEVIRTGADIPVDDYAKMADMLAAHVNRNMLIAGLALGECMIRRKVLILTKRVKHAELLFEKLKHFAGIYHVASDDPDKSAILAGCRSGIIDFNILIGTTGLLGVGVDVPSLDTLIIACDLKSEILTSQSAGRILRLFEGKEMPKIIDLWDNKNSILTRQFYNRKSVYESKGWEIIL